MRIAKKRTTDIFASFAMFFTLLPSSSIYLSWYTHDGYVKSKAWSYNNIMLILMYRYDRKSLEAFYYIHCTTVVGISGRYTGQLHNLCKGRTQ